MFAKSGIPFALLAPQAFVGLMDAISYMVTAPSIVFYVLANGGSYQTYGIILSSYSFSAFIFKPILGYWCDHSRRYRGPYLLSLLIASLGGLTYFLASVFEDTSTALALILIGRLMGGVGQANSTLGFTYVAEVVDKAVLTQASSVLSMVRVLGMVVAPGLNVFLKYMDTTITIGTVDIVLTQLNSVGLFLAIGNALAFLSIYFYLEEPHENGMVVGATADATNKGSADSSTEKKESMWASLFSIEILVPLLSSFSLNANFQLMETGLAPAANDALGWGPVYISAVFGANSILILFAIILTFRLSGKGVSDETLLSLGLVLSVAGYICIYFFWAKPTTTFLFIFPILIVTVAFPFLGSPTRSIFTMVVDSKPSLRNNQGTMQAVMSMVVSVAGFTAPGLISSFILRTPEQVEASNDGREFTAWALFAPVLSFVVLAGHLYVEFIKKPLEQTEKASAAAAPTDGAPGEMTSLLQEEDAPIDIPWSRERYTVPDFDPHTTAARRESLMLMGIIPQITFEDFQEAEAHEGLRFSTGSIPVSRGSNGGGSSQENNNRVSFYL